MAAKLKPKPKTQHDLEEIVELLKQANAGRKPCLCGNCEMDELVLLISIDALLYALGKEPKDFVRMTVRIKREHDTRTEHQCSYVE